MESLGIVVENRGLDLVVSTGTSCHYARAAVQCTCSTGVYFVINNWIGFDRTRDDSISLLPCLSMVFLRS